MTDFLLELRSEEIPARMQDKARDDLARMFTAELAKAGLTASATETYATPRRLALIARDLPLETQAVSEETKGPKTSAPPQALEGFLRKTGLTQDQLVERDGVYFAVVEKAGRKTADVLADAIPAIIRAFPWPKSQRWGAASASTESLRWVRPLQGIVALLGDELVACEVDGIVSSAATMGHRFMVNAQNTVRPELVEGQEAGHERTSTGSARMAIVVGNAADYALKLRAAYVILDQNERRDIIRKGAEKAANDAGFVLVPDEGLVNENAGLTEWPVPMLGRFDAAFLDVPPEVIQLTARVNQKYFVCKSSLERGGGAREASDGGGPLHHPTGGPPPRSGEDLANAFVCTANINAHDGGAAIVAGNEKVLAARLSDAKFFWEADLKIKLEDQAKKLSSIVFHEKLGTVADKVERVAKLARWLVEQGIVKPLPFRGGVGVGPVSLAQTLPIDPTPNPFPEGEGSLTAVQLADMAERAARLCKADLVTGMVGEFPELQGIMGGYYARAQGEGDAVADAIRDHYKPVGQGDDVPTAPVTVAVSLADKLDTLAGFFIIGQQPTGSRDPFALRRAALGVISLILNNGLRLRLGAPLSDHMLAISTPQNVTHYSAVNDLKAFISERFKVQQREHGAGHDVIDALITQHGSDDLVRLLARVKALQAFVGTDEGVNLLAGYKRAANILKANTSDKNDRHPELVSGSYSSDSEESKMLKQVQHDGVSEVEADLQSALTAAEPIAAAAIAAEHFAAAMTALASLRAPIDAFFAGVMVNDPDPDKRAFRIGLLTRFRDAVHTVADFSKIEG